MADYALHSAQLSSRSRPRTHPWLRLFLVILAGIGLGEAFYQFFIAPKVRIETVVIQGDPEVPKEKILELAELERFPQYSKVDIGAIQTRLQNQPWIQSATVEKVFPDKVIITVKARKPIGITLAETENQLEVLAFDEEGTVFVPLNRELDPSLLILAGIRFEGNWERTQLPPALTKAIYLLSKIRTEEPSLMNCFSEFRVVKTGEETFDFLAYPVNYRVPVRLGNRITGETFKSALMVLDVMDRERILDKVEEIDFRTGDIVYRMRGGDIAGR